MAKSSSKVTGKRLSASAKSSRIVQPTVAKASRHAGVMKSTSRRFTDVSTTSTSTSKK